MYHYFGDLNTLAHLHYNLFREKCSKYSKIEIFHNLKLADEEVEIKKNNARMLINWSFLKSKMPGVSA